MPGSTNCLPFSVLVDPLWNLPRRSYKGIQCLYQSPHSLVALFRFIYIYGLYVAVSVKKIVGGWLVEVSCTHALH